MIGSHAKNPEVILVTGAAGFIGMNCAHQLLKDGLKVVGIDNLNDFYDVHLKEARVRELEAFPEFEFVRADLRTPDTLEKAFQSKQIDGVVHLAAEVGVRESLERPTSYMESNVSAFFHTLEQSRRAGVKSFIYASSSSVYGENSGGPLSEELPTDSPISFYAATKKCNEIMATSYANMYGFPVTGLRFFTVYGPWGRPDMAISKFTQKILDGEPIPLFGEGQIWRDFTYVGDIVTTIKQLLFSATPRQGSGVFNVGNKEPVSLLELVETLEKILGKKAEVQRLPMQPGDIRRTQADCRRLRTAINDSPDTELAIGLSRFASWHKEYYKREKGL